MKKSIYVLGTGLSHNGSACLLKDGEICVAIEKERLTRKKCDGYNDTLAINYCLEAERISVHDLDLVVQNAFCRGHLETTNSNFQGERVFTDDVKVPIVTISHHLAHAYSTIGRCPFEGDYGILVMDGSGQQFNECIDKDDVFIPEKDKLHDDVAHLYIEKDSYYQYVNGKMIARYKDFSPFGYSFKDYDVDMYTAHSIGGLYEAISNYIFRSRDDVGKLMGLSPYGSPGVYKEELFLLRDGRVFVNHEVIRKMGRPAKSHHDFKKNFKYFADIAFWAQAEIERAVLYVVDERTKLTGLKNLCYAGGLALNAVANNCILNKTNIENLYVQPAAGDNGVAIGCAYYGWLEVLKRDREVKKNSSSCFGYSYKQEEVEKALCSYENKWNSRDFRNKIDVFFNTVEHHSDPNKVKKHEAVILFNIRDYCKYFVVSKDGRIRCVKDAALKPDCTIDLDELHFSTIIYDKKSFDVLLEAGRIAVDNPKELDWLLSIIDIDRITNYVLSSGDYNEPITGKFYYSNDYIKETASLLAKGKVIAWFQGESEFGPRALGRRSILADPRIASIKGYINSEIKFREDFRPFAPSVLREDVGIYFKTDRESPYMILVDHVREEWRHKIGGVVHENNTSRIQTVTSDWNVRYYELLKAFKEITGISLLLNTSLNRRGMPIVETPKEALDFFYSCRLDYLIIDKFIVSK